MQKKKENKEENKNNEITAENNEENAQEELKIKQEFFKNIVNDFKKVFITYLEKLLKN